MASWCGCGGSEALRAAREDETLEWSPDGDASEAEWTGKRVRVVGLQKSREANGKLGVVERYSRKKHRFSVRLDDAAKNVLIRPSNLEVVSAEATDTGGSLYGDVLSMVFA